MKPGEYHFVFIGNNPAVDFTNTEIVVRGRPRDLLQRDADLVHWTREAGFSTRSRLNPGDLAAARELRAALKVLFQAKIDRQPVSRKALAVVNQHLANHCTHRELQVSSDGGELQLVPSGNALSVPVLLAILANEGAVLLDSRQAEHLRRCSNTDCILMFVDTSRSHRRRWCSMDTCGNRAKVAKHYHNHTSH